jgi:uncharacterized membrane protein YgaE (UPF0421/DUF939 family)
MIIENMYWFLFNSVKYTDYEGERWIQGIRKYYAKMNGTGSYRKQEIMHHIWKAFAEDYRAQILQQILTTQEIMDWTQKCIQWWALALNESQL